MTQAVIIIVIIAAVLGAGALVVRRFLRSEVSMLFSQILRALRNGEADFTSEIEKPRSLSDMTSVLLPRLREDFPGFSLEQFYSQAKSYALSVLEKDGPVRLHKTALSAYDRKAPEKTITVQLSAERGSGENKKQLRCEMKAQNTELIEQLEKDYVTGLNCPNCGAPLDLGSVRCRYCGTSFRNPPKLDWTFFDLRDV